MKDWKIQLLSPKGEVFELGSLGYAAATMEHSFILPEIRQFFKASTLTQRELMLAGLTQMLLNENALPWHGFRLVWGDASPYEAHAAYPNGKDTRWTLYRLINGQVQTLLQGELPANWWELSPEEQEWLVEERHIESEADF